MKTFNQLSKAEQDRILRSLKVAGIKDADTKKIKVPEVSDDPYYSK